MSSNTEFRLPELGEGVHEGELVKWKIQAGDSVKDDQPLLEIMTDKATVEIPSPFAGVIHSLHAKEGEVVKVGQLLITAGASASPSAGKPSVASTPAPVSAPVSGAASASVSAKAPAMQAPSSSNGGAVFAAPSTRRFAREKGVDLGSLQGSGPHGRVMREDVEHAGTSGGSSSKILPGTSSGAVGAEQRVPFRGLRKKIAEKMRLSKDRAAHFTYVEEADASELVQVRTHAKELGARQGVKVTYLPFLMKGMVAALRQFPILNSTLDEQRGELIYKHYYNIGLSIQTDDGLMAPVVKGVEHKSILELAKDIQDLVERARSKRLTMEDLQGSTITLTNAGSIGGLFATPIINYPEVAILGFNKIFKKAVVKNINSQDQIVIRDWTYFSLSLDHRVVDGAVGAEFMNTFIKYMETPSLLLMEAF